MVLLQQDFIVSRAMALNTCSALTLMCWDWILCLADENDYIWRRPRNSLIKWLYVFFRYGGLIVQGANMFFVMRMETYEPISRAVCRHWIIYQGIAVEVLLVGVDGLMILRVYALWSHNRLILGVLLILVVLEVCSMVLSATIIAHDPDVNELCLFRTTPRAVALFGVVAMSTQSVIMFLTLRKYFSTFARRLSRARLSVIVVRDGGVAFMGFFFVFMGALCYAIVASEYSDSLYYWNVCILSICGCRIIINLDRYAARTSINPSRITDSIWLTTIYVED